VFLILWILSGALAQSPGPQQESDPTDVSEPTIPVDIQVRDRTDGDPIRNARISADALETYTDGRGRAHLKLSEGLVTLTVTANAYVSQTISVRATRTQPLRIWMTALGDYEIVVEGLRPSEHPSRHVMDAEQALETPGNHEDAVRLVQSLPGAAVQREYSPGAGDLSIRGSAPGDSRYYLDGVEIPFLYHFNQYASVFPASQLDTLELYPSTFGAKYGDAVGGIVEAHSPLEPPQSVHGSVSASFVMGSADVRAPVNDDWWVSAAARRSYFDLAGEQSEQYPRWPRFHDYVLRVENGDTHRGTGFFAWGAADTYDRAAGELDILDGYESAVTPTLSYGNRFRIFGGRHHWPNGRVVLAAVNHQRNNTLTGGGREDLRDWTVTSRLDTHGQPTDAIRWQAGYEARLSDTSLVVEDPEGVGILVAEEAPGIARGVEVNGTLTRARISTYGTTHLIAKDVRVIPGLRLGYDSTERSMLVEPRLATRWRLADQTALKLGAGRYLQRPPSEQLIGVPPLPTTASWQVAFGIEQSVANRLEIGLEAYRKWSIDPVLFPVNGLGIVAERGDGYGIELLTRYRLRERFFLWGWLAHARSTVDLGPDRVSADGDQPINAGIVSSWDVGNWNLGLRYRYGTGLPFTAVSDTVYNANSDTWLPISDVENGLRMPAYQKLDVRIAHTWTFRGWTLTGSLEVWYVPKPSTQLFPIWSYDWSEQSYVYGPTVLPLMGLRARF
jgi:hypothetical protein